MHILLLPSWYSTKQNPIRGSFFRDQALALIREGHQVGMIVPPSRFCTFNGLRDAVSNWYKSPLDLEITEDDGIHIYRMPWWGWLASVLPQMRGELVLKVFNNYCHEQGIPDVLHGHSILYGAYLAAYIGNKKNIPSILTEHSSLFISKGHQPWHKSFIRYTLSHINKILAVGPSLQKAIQSYENEKPVDLIGNVVNTKQFNLSQKIVKASPFVLSIFGRLEKNKAQNIALEAFALAFRGKDARLMLVGSGNMREHYQKLAEDLGIASQTIFYGQASREEVVSLMQKSHLIVSSSYIETFGVTLIEAMACGKPVIATCSGGPEALVNEDTGILVPVGNPQALADAMHQIHANYAQYNPMKIRQCVVERFSEEAIAQQLIQHYEGLIS